MGFDQPAVNNPPSKARSMLEDVMKRTLVLLAILTTALSGLPLAASTPNTGPRPYDSVDSGVMSADITRFAKCTVREIIPPRRVILYEHESRKLVKMDLDETVELTARRKKDFDGRSQIQFADLEVGQVVKVNYRADSGLVLGVKVVGVAQ